MSDLTGPRFTKSQEKQLIKAMQDIINSRYKDPTNKPDLKEIYGNYGKKQNIEEFYKPGKLLDVIGTAWQQYLIHAISDGLPETKLRTSTKRKAAARNLKKLLGKTPTIADLREECPLVLSIDNEIAEILEADLKELLRR